MLDPLRLAPRFVLFAEPGRGDAVARAEHAAVRYKVGERLLALPVGGRRLHHRLRLAQAVGEPARTPLHRPSEDGGAGLRRVDDGGLHGVVTVLAARPGGGEGQFSQTTPNSVVVGARLGPVVAGQEQLEHWNKLERLLV